MTAAPGDPAGGALADWLDAVAPPRRWQTRISASDWKVGDLIYVDHYWARIEAVGPAEPDAGRAAGYSLRADVVECRARYRP